MGCRSGSRLRGDVSIWPVVRVVDVVYIFLSVLFFMHFCSRLDDVVHTCYSLVIMFTWIK